MTCNLGWVTLESYILFFNFNFIYLFCKERGREGEREGEKHQCVVVPPLPPTGDLARNLSMCPEWKSSQWPFGSQASTQSTEPHQPGRVVFFPKIILIICLHVMSCPWLLEYKGKQSRFPVF